MLADMGHWGHASMPVLVCQSKKQQWPLLCMYVQEKGFHVSVHGKGRSSEFARSVGKHGIPYIHEKFCQIGVSCRDDSSTNSQAE